MHFVEVANLLFCLSLEIEKKKNRQQGFSSIRMERGDNLCAPLAVILPSKIHVGASESRSLVLGSDAGGIYDLLQGVIAWNRCCFIYGSDALVECNQLTNYRLYLFPFHT